MTVHLEPILYTVRWFGEGLTYDSHDPFDAVATMYVFEGYRATISAMKGKMTRRFRREFEELLKSMGIVEVEVVRHKGRRTYRTDT